MIETPFLKSKGLGGIYRPALCWIEDFSELHNIVFFKEAQTKDVCQVA